MPSRPIQLACSNSRSAANLRAWSVLYRRLADPVYENCSMTRYIQPSLPRSKKRQLQQTASFGAGCLAQRFSENVIGSTLLKGRTGGRSPPLRDAQKIARN